MIIAQTSDNHLGLTKPNTYRKMLVKLSKEDFDIFVHCGDYCGGRNGHKTLGLSVKIFREIFPDKPYLSVIGNHDFWTDSGRGSTSMDLFYKNLDKIRSIFKDNNVHFLDDDGILDFKGWKFVGNSGWYTNPNPPTNDAYFLPSCLEGDTNSYLLNRAYKGLDSQLDQLDPGLDKIIFVSHFPVIPSYNLGKGFEIYSWSKAVGEVLTDEYKCRYFLNGHAHQLHHGPLRYESGPDYGTPAFQLIHVMDDPLSDNTKDDSDEEARQA